MLCQILLMFFCLIGWIYFSTLAKIASEEQPFLSPPAEREPTLAERKQEAQELVARLLAESKARNTKSAAQPGKEM